jgi:hypothetical protein
MFTLSDHGQFKAGATHRRRLFLRKPVVHR